MEETAKRVLVVDDDPALLRLLADYLRAHGFAVDAVATGRAALERMRAHRFALLLVDLTLPDLSGFELLEQIPRTPQLAGTPLLVISARSSPIDRAQSVELGASEYLAKPFTLAALGAAVDALLSTPRPALAAADQLQAL